MSKLTLYLVLILVLVGGWVANIVKLAGMCCEFSGELALRVVGIFIPPLGTVLGIFL